MNVAGGGFIAVFGLIYLGGIAALVVAIVLSVRAWMHAAKALERIADALEKRPPAQGG